LTREQQQFDQARQTFWLNCTPQMLQQLRAGFAALVDQSPRLGEPCADSSKATLAPLPRNSVFDIDPLPANRQGLPAGGAITKVRILLQVSAPAEDRISADYISRLTSGRRE